MLQGKNQHGSDCGEEWRVTWGVTIRPIFLLDNPWNWFQTQHGGFLLLFKNQKAGGRHTEQQGIGITRFHLDLLTDLLRIGGVETAEFRTGDSDNRSSRCPLWSLV